MKTVHTIPLFIVEEHHEAFIVWNYAIQQGLIPATGNYLFHIDEHSDMATPRFNESIHNLNGNIDKVKEFTYKELNIASFIIPACYRGIFQKVYWIRQRHKKEFHKPHKMYVRSYNNNGTKLISGKSQIVESSSFENSSIFFDYYLRTIQKVPSNNKVILDIDLDYFSCSGNPNELDEIYIEITEDEFHNFNKNKYHRLNYGSFGRIETFEKDNKFYYVVNYYKEIYPPKESKVDEEEIDKRINYFANMLKGKNIQPRIIDICRSRYSGYTPADQWKMIENKLLKRLSQIYTIDLKSNE